MTQFGCCAPVGGWSLWRGMGETSKRKGVFTLTRENLGKNIWIYLRRVFYDDMMASIHRLYLFEF